MMGKNNGDGIIRMVIEFNPTTEGCQVTGPIKSPSICYSMLEMARDVIQDTAAKMKEAGLKKPPNGFDPKGPLRVV